MHKEKKRDNELSLKVLDVSILFNNIYRELNRFLSISIDILLIECVWQWLFPVIIYLAQEQLKDTLKTYLSEKHPDYMANLLSNDFVNNFHEKWMSPVSLTNIVKLLLRININHSIL